MVTFVLLNADADGDIRPADGLQELGYGLSFRFRVADLGRNQFDVEFGRLQEQGQRPGIIDIVADIGIEDDRDFLPRRPGQLPAGRTGA